MDINLLSTSQSKTIPIWIRDTYAKIQPQYIFNLEGRSYNEEISKSEEDAVNNFNMRSPFFIAGNNIFGHLYRIVDKNICQQYVTIVIQGLRDLYWNDKHLLSQDEIP